MIKIIDSFILSLNEVILQETCGNVNIVVCLVLQIIGLSASANKLSKLQERSDEYAALIMEELDPDNLGYIEVCVLSITEN